MCHAGNAKLFLRETCLGGVGAMVMIAKYQYGWTFFVPDIQKKFGWDRASIQLAFTLFALFETWLVPVEGWFVDKYGPRLVVRVAVFSAPWDGQSTRKRPLSTAIISE